MTEQEAIERIANDMNQLLRDYPYAGDLSGEQIARAAWKAMKAIVREAKPATTLYVPLGATDDDAKAMLELVLGMQAEGQSIKPNPVMPNDSGTGWL